MTSLIRGLVLGSLLSCLPPPGPEPEDDRPPLLEALTISSGELSPAFSSDTFEYSVSSLNSIFPISVTATAPGNRILINGRPALSGEALWLTLQPREDLSVVVLGAEGVSRTVVIHALPAELPSFTIFRDVDTAGGEEDVLLTPNESALLRVDRSGAPVYYRQFAPAQVFDFQQHRLPSGELIYSYTLYPAGGGSGSTRLMSRTFEDLGEVRVLAHGDHGELPTDAHEFLVLGDQHYVVMAYDERRIDLSPRWSSAARVTAAIVQEIDHGVVLFEWDSTEHPSLFSDSVDGNAFDASAASDYVHLNSIDIDPTDQNLILSLRHANSVLKIDRQSGQTIWTLGGASDQFKLTDGQRFSHQHFARLQADHSLLLFDNGNGAHQTRVLWFNLDEANRAVTGFRVIYERPAGLPQTSFMGSVSGFEGDRQVIGWGGWTPPEVAPPSVTELVDGAVSWSLTFDSPKVYSYRAMPALER
jgi:arylsulfate sulfotransferase